MVSSNIPIPIEPPWIHHETQLQGIQGIQGASQRPDDATAHQNGQGQPTSEVGDQFAPLGTYWPRGPKRRFYGLWVCECSMTSWRFQSW